MRTAETDILMVTGHGDSDSGHWQSRWQAKLPTARRVAQRDFARPRLQEWTEELVAEVGRSTRPTVLIAHALGALTVIHAAAALAGSRVRGAFLVAPHGETYVVENEEIDLTFAHVPRRPLPFPAVLVASHSDSTCPILEAEERAVAWGADFVDAGDSGHLDTASGHGPWPEGLMRLAAFLQKLG
jgi:hypothetical protein